MDSSSWPWPSIPRRSLPTGSWGVAESVKDPITAEFASRVRLVPVHIGQGCHQSPMHSLTQPALTRRDPRLFREETAKDLDDKTPLRMADYKGLC